MNIFDLSASTNAVKLNETLNPTIWTKHEHLKNAVRDQILIGAEEYCSYLGLTEAQVKDIIVSGENASFKYTNKSTVDVVVVAELNPDPTFREFFNENKYKYNGQQQVQVAGHLVKFYVQPADETFVNNGSYSVLQEFWVDIPRRRIAEDTVSKLKALEAAAQPKPVKTKLKEKAIEPQRITYGFKTPKVAEDVGMSWDGVSPSTKMFLSETDSDEAVLQDFIEFCVKELKIETMPKIKLRRDPQWSVVNKTFGRYNDAAHTLEVAFGQRHIMDILRTVAHELTHTHQHERESVPTDAGETGSPYENEANARAGVLMRDYGRLHPELFDTNGLDESASGYIPTKKQAKDPRFSMALTQDIRPGQLGKEANKLNLKTNKQGIPQVANPNGLFEKLALELAEFKEGRVPNRPLSQVPGEVEDDLGNQEATGPEFPPEWPEGTTKIDVSDLTDWYRLGMDISDMDDADPADYNQGPPQTVVVFPSDEIEQGYLPQLKRLGLKTHDIDASQEHKPGRPQPKKKLAEEELSEVRMSPSNLMQWATSPEAQGIRAGFEAELIFRDTTNNGDSDYEMEPDYDADERCYSLGQVVDFFESGDFGISSRQADRLREQLDEAYYEWYDEQMHKDFRAEAEDLIRKVLVDEDDWDLDNEIQKQLIMQDVSDDELTAIIQAGERAPKFTSSKEQILYAEANPLYEKYLDAQEEAEGLLDDLVADEVGKQGAIWDAALDDFRDSYSLDDDSGFFDDAGLRWMSDVSNNYDVDWPYMTGGGGNEGSRDWDSIGDSLNGAIDMTVKVSSGYHQAARREDQWIVEPDTSLEPDDSEDFGLEIISPPMPLLTTLEKLQQVCDWANNPQEGNAYTNGSTGLHMGVSVPFKGGDVDYLKLILFLGDEYVLRSFGREANTYTKSAMSKFRENIKGGRADPMAAIKLMQSGLIELAHREIQKGVGDGKYTSAHIQKGYIEFRSPGGDWLAEESADPEKLQSTMLRFARAMSLAANPAEERREYAKKLYKLVAPEGDSELALFSQFAAGELTAEQLKKRWAEKTIGTEKKMNQRWRLYQNVNGRWEPVPGAEWNGYPEDEVKMRVWAKYGREALDSGEYQLVNMGEQDWEVYDVKTGATLEIVKGKSKGEVADQVFDKYVDQGIGFQVRPWEDPAKMTPRAKLAKRIAQTKKPTEYNYEIVDLGDVNLRVIDRFYAANKQEADKTFDQWLEIRRLPNDTDTYGYRPRKQEAAKEPAVQDTDINVAQNFNQPQNATDRVGSWSIYDVTLGREISRMDNVAWQQASDRADELEQSTGHNMSVRGLQENFVNEVVKMPPVNMVFSNENLVDWAYNDAQKKQAQQLSALKTDVPTKVYDMGDHVRVFVLDDQGPVLYLALEKFLDGFKTNAVQIHPRGQGKNLGFKIYQSVSDTFQRPLYSDYTHTDASRLGIWKKLIDRFPDRIVGYDQRTKEDLPLSSTPQGPAVRGNQPVYAQRGTKDQSKPVTGDTRSRTRLLKFLPAINENFTTSQKLINELALKTTLPVVQQPSPPGRYIYDMKTQNGEYHIVFSIEDLDENWDDEEDYDGPTGFALRMYFLGKGKDGRLTQLDTNIGEKEVLKIYATMAKLTVQIIQAHPEITEIMVEGVNDQRQRIYTRLIQQNIARLLPGWAPGGEGLVKIKENFADGKGPGRPGDSQRHGIPKGATMAQLEKAAKAPGRKGQLARWQINMRRGKKK